MKIEDLHTRVWELSSERRKWLILSAMVEVYSAALENMKEALRDYNKALENYEVMHIYVCIQLHAHTMNKRFFLKTVEEASRVLENSSKG